MHGQPELDISGLETGEDEDSDDPGDGPERGLSLRRNYHYAKLPAASKPRSGNGGLRLSSSAGRIAAKRYAWPGLGRMMGSHTGQESGMGEPEHADVVVIGLRPGGGYAAGTLAEATA